MLTAEAHEIDGVFQIAALNEVCGPHFFDDVFELIQLSSYRNPSDVSAARTLRIEDCDGLERRLLFLEEVDEALSFTIQADDEYGVRSGIFPQYFALPRVEGKVPHDGERKVDDAGIHEEKSAEEAIVKEVVRESEECRCEHTGKEEMCQIFPAALNTRQSEDAEFKHRDDPERCDDDDCLQILIQREVRGYDESDADEICDGIRGHEQGDVGQKPADEEESPAHGEIIPLLHSFETKKECKECNENKECRDRCILCIPCIPCIPCFPYFLACHRYGSFVTSHGIFFPGTYWPLAMDDDPAKTTCSMKSYFALRTLFFAAIFLNASF